MTQSRIASLIASLRVLLPDETGHHPRAEQFHAEDIQLLAANVFLAHVDVAFQPEQRADGGGGDAVLAGAGFRDDALLAHALRKQALAQAVVDLVRAGVVQVFAFQIDLRIRPMRSSAVPRR